ncbi:sensor histidine kinase [Bacillus sp. AFS002410]|uniref:sensor histidine kinase n=1 Tax=Bacillus sp. AFS002410 TaxID=2033481 RepID=UPI000BF1C594|nr:sensor histidine kinase [Bacillus sp. AFS002410]PEJ58350.1 sensor histidine kinase [Bacillus sp. AFS002410]
MKKFLLFLKFEKSYLFLYFISNIIFVALLTTDPSISFRWDTFIYAFALNILIFIAFLLYRFQKNSQAIRHIDEEDYENLSFEGVFYEQYIEELKRNHIRTINDVQAKQKEYHDYIVSWFHEIKTPISVLRLMQQTDFEPKSLIEEITKIEQYVDQALYYAKLDNFNQDYEIKNCNLDRLVKDTLKTHSKAFFAKKIRLNLSIEPTIIQSDSKWLQFILNQLITNSLKYTNENGEIAISTNETQQEKLLIIEDNGVGIKQEDLPRIFNRGFTGTNGRIFTKSTGMGLYLAQELSNKLGHFITCTSDENVYTQFVIHFPKNIDPFWATKKNSLAHSKGAPL